MLTDKKELAASEELILNTITAINNLSYFDIDSSAVTKAQLSLAKGIHLTCRLALWAYHPVLLLGW